jgi:hypothetical protein
MHGVPTPGERRRFVALCRDDQHINTAFALTDSGELWGIYADPGCSRFGGEEVKGVSGVIIALAVECVDGRLLLHDNVGRLWMYHPCSGPGAAPRPFLLQLSPYATTTTSSDLPPPLMGCLVANGNAVVGYAHCAVASLCLAGVTRMSTLRLWPPMPSSCSASVVQMCFCQRSACLLILLDNKSLLVVMIDKTANESPAVCFTLPTPSTVLCILAGIVVGSCGGLWCVNIRRPPDVTTAVLVHLGRVQRGVLNCPNVGVILPHAI